MIPASSRKHKHAPRDRAPNCSRKQHSLLFDTHATFDALEDNAGGDLGKLFGLDFVEASAVDAAFRNQLGGFANRFFTVPFGVWSGPCCRGRW